MTKLTLRKALAAHRLRETAAAPQVPAGYKLLKNTTHDERRWHEDAKHENGSYFNECVRCLRSFVGHKRRGVCRACAQPEAAPGAPQPAERVPLTRAQVDACWDGLMPSGHGKSRYDIARAIEAAHGISAAGVKEPGQPAPQAPLQLGPEEADFMRLELKRSCREVFDAEGPETPQVVRDVIEYADSWLAVFLQKRLDRAAGVKEPEAEVEALQQKADRLEKALAFISTADTCLELYPVRPHDVEYAEDGNTVLRYVGPWYFLRGKGNTFLEAVEAAMKKKAT